jgi:hypothetical protein
MLVGTDFINQFPPIQQRMIRLLLDGLPHTDRELFLCLGDDLSPLSNIRFHITKIRERVRGVGREIACQQDRREGITYYRLVQYLSPDSL